MKYSNEVVSPSSVLLAVVMVLGFLPGYLNCLAMADCIGMHRIEVVNGAGSPIENLRVTFIHETGEEHNFTCPDEEEHRCGQQGIVQVYFNGNLTITLEGEASQTVRLETRQVETCGCPKMVDKVVTFP